MLESIDFWRLNIVVIAKAVIDVACKNIRFSSLFAAGDATKSEEKRMFSQAIIDDNNIKVPWEKDNNNDRHNETFFHHLVNC